MVEVEKLLPLKGKVLVEPAYDPPMEGSLLIPLQAQAVYPVVGYVLAKGELSEAIEIGDLVLFAASSLLVPPSDYPVTHIVFSDQSELLTFEEYYDPTKELLDVHKKNPSAEDFTLNLRALDGFEWSFKTSEIVSLSVGRVSNSSYEVSQLADVVHIVKTQPAGYPERIFYFLHESLILGVIK